MAIHRLLSQNKDEFETFFENLDLCFDHMAEKNHFMIAVFCNFKQSQNFGILMIISSFEVLKVDFLTSRFGFHQIINNPTHILNN